MEKTTIPEEKLEKAAETGDKAKKKIPENKKFLAVVAGIVLVSIVAGILVVPKILSSSKPEPEVITVSTLEKIINVSKLSTFTAVYNGIAQVMNEKKPEETDYYVSYEARVNAGIDFEKIEISVDSEAKAINIDIPEVYITEVNVDISSLDFIFYNKKANTSTVTQEAFKACEEDVRRESEQQAAIFELAQQNAENVLTALTRPIVEQLDSEYTLVID
ncbi:DUF4230 domain-containing protein [Ventrimonas sp. CLA-AP-H27]|uniref:DUF4230 domain-containing protein n=1 Tax=Ventrimonas faecis TaxID=3133170 RepID=A0ABV1HNV0_9FIRM